MSERSALIFLYDGSFDGLLSCVAYALKEKLIPAEIYLRDEAPPSLFPQLEISGSAARAGELQQHIRQSISPRALHLVKRAFLTDAEEREQMILRYLQLGFQIGSAILGRLTDPAVEPLLRAVRFLENEAELYRGFVRFSDLNGVLVSVIHPKNQVLPLLAGHFLARCPDERLLIYDGTHRSFLFCDRGSYRLGAMDDFQPTLPPPEERNYRALWQTFYETVSIPQRYNPRCRQSHMAKRYWVDLTEFWEREAYVDPSAKRALP